MCIGKFNTENISLQTSVALWLVFIVIAVLGFWGFICPPKGVIDASVLKIATILFGIAGLAIVREALREAFTRGVDAKVKHGDTEIEITQD